jgi:alanyl-tRNA synthetase
MVKIEEIIQSYVSFFEKRRHRIIANSSLVPENDPTTLFTSSGMQPLIPYLLGKPHPQGKRLVNVQNCFRAQDIDEIGDNRHTTFFRMLGNWSLGDYFKNEQIHWFWEFLTEELKLDPNRFYVTCFDGYKNIPLDHESRDIWLTLFERAGIKGHERIFYRGLSDNWWSRSGTPDEMPEGEIGGPDTEVYFDFHPEKGRVADFEEASKSGRLLEIGNSVFMTYQKRNNEFIKLEQKNVDFGGGAERLLGALEGKEDIFQTSLFSPIIKSIEKETKSEYLQNQIQMRIITDHFVAGSFIASEGIFPSNKDQGYILRRLIRRGLDNFFALNGEDFTPILTAIIDQYRKTDPKLEAKFEKIKGVFQEEEQAYKATLSKAKKYIDKKYKAIKVEGDELMGKVKISASDAFVLYTTHGLSPSQIKSLGYAFDEKEFANKMKEHQDISRKGVEQRFKGGLADQSEKTVMGHTATHLLHQAIRDVLGDTVYQTGSNITVDRLRFDFSYDQKLDDNQIKKIEGIVNKKIEENLPVHFEILDLEEARKLGAIGLFDEKYKNKVKVYFIGEYSKEFCGGPHVDFTGKLKGFKIVKQESIGGGKKRIYAQVLG